MTKIKLFEIIVYPSSESVYYKKWEDEKEKYICHQIQTGGTTYEEGLMSFNHAYHGLYNWDYNKLCGFITVYYDSKSGDIKFEIFKQSRNIYNKHVKLRLEKYSEENASNLHIYVRNKSNREIVKSIDNLLRYIKKNFFSKSFIDKECYETIKYNVDYNKIFKSLI